MKQKYFLAFLGLFLTLRLLVITHLGFIDDEAYHWSWAKNIDISYFDHPGMVAWIIWPFIQIFGDVEWAVRLPGFLVYLGILFVMYKLAVDLFGLATAQLCLLLLFFIPLWGFASLGTMPDIPLGLFWILSAWIFWQSVRQDSKAWTPQKTWLWLGVSMGLGMNSKLTCCLIGLGMGLFLLMTPRLRWHLRTPWPYLGALLTFALMTPIFVWNAQHQWASFDYQFVARHQEEHHLDLNRWLQFWVLQWLFMSPVIYFLMLLTFVVGVRRWSDDRWRFLLCLPLPALVLFYYQPLMAAYKPHWSGPAYMILLLGAVELFRTGVPGFFAPRSPLVRNLALAFLLPIQLIYVPLFTPIIPKVYAQFQNAAEWQPVWDVSNEFYGWRELGQHLRDLQVEHLNKTGKALPIAGQRYEIVAQLTWGSGEKVWQLSPDRDHYLYQQTPEDLILLQGSSFLVVNDDKYPRDPMDAAQFSKCQKEEWPFYRGQTLARTFYIYHCEGFQKIK